VAKKKTPSAFFIKLKRFVLGLIIANVLFIVLTKWINTPMTTVMFGSIIKGNGLTREYISYNEMGRNAKLAVICSEDQLFPDHNGFDMDAIKKAYTSTDFDPIQVLNLFASKNDAGDGDAFQEQYIDKESDLSLTDVTSPELNKEYLTSYDKVIEEIVSAPWLAGEYFGYDQNVETTITIRKHEAQTVKITDKLSNYNPGSNLLPLTDDAVDVQNNTFQKLKNVQNYRVQNYGYIGRLMNVMVNLNFVAQVLSNYTDPKTSSISVFDFLDNLMDSLLSPKKNWAVPRL
jgi:hypothetical protein